MKKSSVIIALNEGLKEQIRSEAKRLSLTMAAYIRLVLLKQLEGPSRDHTANNQVLHVAGPSEGVN